MIDRRLQRALNGRQFRWTEMYLLVLPAAFMLVGLLALIIVNNPATATALAQKSLPPLSAFGPAIGLIAALVGAHILLNIVAPDADQTLLPIAGTLASIGVLMSIRLGPDVGSVNLGSKQLLFVVLGLLICVGTVRATRNLNWLRNYKYTWAAAGLALVAFALVRAHSFTTSQPGRDVLTINIGGTVENGFTFQPSELLKICLVIFFAGYLSENREMLAVGGYRLGPIVLPPLKQLGPLLVMLGVALALFIGVRELGLAIIIFGLFLSMLYAASARPIYIVGSLILFALGSLLALHFFSYARVRVDIVGSAFGDPTGNGFQNVQGLLAFAHGGIFGDGFGLGHPYLVPASNTDFIASSFGEEFGFAGLLALIGLFMLLVYRGMHIAVNARGTFNQLLAVGLTAVFALQTLVILAGNLKIMPLTGVPLPFVAYGGSSLIANFIIVGLLLRLSQARA